MIKKLMPLYMVVLMVLSLALIYGCGSAPTSGGGGGGGTTTYTLSVTVTPDVTFGTVEASPNLDNWTYLSGATVELTATGLGTYEFSSWEGGATGNTSPTHVTMTANKSVTAHFRLNTGLSYLLSVFATPDAGGTVEVNPLQANYTDGTYVALTAEAATGYAFSHWTGSLEGSSSRETILMNGTKEVTAVFTPIVSTESYLGVVTGLYNLSDTKCLTDLLISSDVISKRIYFDAENGSKQATGTWTLLSSGFSQIPFSTNPDFVNMYFYNNPAGIVFSASTTEGGGAIIWAAAPTAEPSYSGITCNLMQIRHIGHMDNFQPTGQPTYFRFLISGSGGSYTDTFSVKQFDGSEMLSGTMTLTHQNTYLNNEYLEGSVTPPGGSAEYTRICPSPSGMLVGSTGNDSEHYDCAVGGIAYTLGAGELVGKKFVGLLITSSETVYLVGTGEASNQVYVDVITDPTTSSDYPGGAPDATIHLVTEMSGQNGVWSGTVTDPGGTYACDAIVTKVGPSQNKLLLCGLVSKEALGPGYYKSENFFLIEK